MKNSIKIVTGLLILFVAIVIFAKIYTPKSEYYRNIADIVTSLYRSKNYDTKGIKKSDREAINKFLSTLTHENEEICVSDYINEDSNPTGEENSPFITLDNGKCYIYYDDLKLANVKENKDTEMEPYDVLYCNGYEVILYKSYFNPEYSVTKKDPRHDYIYDSYEKYNGGYNYYYISSYDGTKIKVKINVENNKIIKIEVKDVNI